MKTTVLLDVDGTVASLLDALYSYLDEREKLGRKAKLLYMLHKIRGKLNLPISLGGGRTYKRVYALIDELLKNRAERERLKQYIMENIYPDALEALKELSSIEGTRIVLFSNSPHNAIKLLGEILKERGIRVDAAVGSHPILGPGKQNIIEMGLLPDDWLRGPLLRVDNRDNERDIRKLGRMMPHLHVVFVEDKWLGDRRDPPISKIDWEEEINRARERWEERKRLKYP